MREKKTKVVTVKKHRGRVLLWLFFVVLIIAGAVAWVLHDGGIVNLRDMVKRVIPTESVEQVVEVPVVEENASVQNDVVETEQVVETTEMQPACAVIENLLSVYIEPDNYADYNAQEYSSKIYMTLSKYGCPENSMFFKDMAARKQAIADGLRAGYWVERDSGASTEYLYSDEKICQAIEKRVTKNINPDAYDYKQFLSNANTYAVLYEYGCCDNKPAYMRAAIRELGIAVALMPTDKMTREEIVQVVEICKSLGVADAAHLMLQRLKARGYDMGFLLEMENIIHGIR